jgi:hypothetical protein
MSVDYNNFATTFSNSRKNMKWEEIDYFISYFTTPLTKGVRGGAKTDNSNLSILDIGC